MSHVILPGSKVRMHFTLRLMDDTVVESSFGGEPVEFVMGDGTLVTGLERALYGLQAGRQQSLQISPQEGFGMRNPEHVHMLKRAAFPEEILLEPGVIISFALPGAEEIPGTILEIGADEVRVDFNHPLAGREVIFDVDILDVVTPVANEE